MGDPARTLDPAPAGEVVFGPGALVGVAVDGQRWTTPLTYRVPAGCTVRVGDAVTVPFGSRVLRGLVVGVGEPVPRIRDLLGRVGTRTHPQIVTAALEIAHRHLVSPQRVLARVAPTHGKGSAAVDAGPLRLDPAARTRVPDPGDDTPPRRVLLCAPLVDQCALAAVEAERIHRRTGGQVLVVCPTVEHLDRVLGWFPSGAMRATANDATAWASLRDGTCPVGVGTRVAAWWSVADFGGIVVVDDPNPAHRDPTRPRTHSREPAALRTRLGGAELVVICDRPTPPTLGVGAKVVPVGDRDRWPRLVVLDRRRFPPDQRAVPPPVAAACRKGAQVVIDGRCERRCGRCRRLIRCPRGCHPTRCTHPTPCPRCGSRASGVSGLDATRVQGLYPRGARPVLVGDLPGPEDTTGASRTVIIPGWDRFRRSASLDPDGPALRVLVRAARLAGPDGTLIVVTDTPEDPLLAEAARGDLMAAARRCWEVARSAGLPPFRTLVELTTPGRPDTTGWPGQVLGPEPRSDRWVTTVLVDRDQLDALHRALGDLPDRRDVSLVVI